MRSFQTTLILVLAFFTASCQSFKDKMKAKVPKKDKSAQYECGYIHKATIAEKANPMAALQKGLGKAFTAPNNPDLGTAAISIFYQAHLHPQTIIRYATKIPGWETCGDAVFLSFTNRNGIGLSGTDGEVKISGKIIEKAGAGTYFHGFNEKERDEKTVEITSSNGDKISVKVKPSAPLEIKSIDGKAKGEEIILDGTKDIVIELANGDAQPNSKLHVQIIAKLMSTPIMYDLYISKPTNTITIPREAFKNYEGGPSPYMKNNTIIVNRVTETILEGTDAGAIRTISTYMDWAPVKIGGDLGKGNVITMGMDASKNISIRDSAGRLNDYLFLVAKDGPFSAPPIKYIKDAAIISFVVRGNMVDKKVTSGSNATEVWILTQTKWFPEYSDNTWQLLADKMYADFEKQIKADLDYNILPLDQVVGAKAYKYAKEIKDTTNVNFVEKGAGGTKRVLVTSNQDYFKDMSITFGSDFVGERLIKELGVNCAIAVTIDLNFNFETEALDPVITIVGYAPMLSYKTGSKYFTIKAKTSAKSLSESKKHAGSATEVLYKMLKEDAFAKGFTKALKQLSEKEAKHPAYKILWENKF